MKEIKISKSLLVAIVDDEDFELVNQYKWHISIERNNVYAVRSYSINKAIKTQRMHRLIMGETDSKISIDHKNRNGLDNRKINLRKCTQSQNCQNQSKKGIESGNYKGVSLDPQSNKYRVSICVSGEKKELGRHESKEHAARIYDAAAIKYFGEFACLNFPD